MKFMTKKPINAPTPIQVNGKSVFLEAGEQIQTFLVPTFVFKIYIKIWSAGGASGDGNLGGASSFLTAELNVFPWETLSIYVGLTGMPSSGQWNAGAGGGASAILRGPAVLAVAGAGSGGALNNTQYIHGRGLVPQGTELSPNGGDGQGMCTPLSTLGGWGFGKGGDAGHNCGFGLIAGAGGGAGYVGGDGGIGTSSGMGGYSYVNTDLLTNIVIDSDTPTPGSFDSDYDINFGLPGKNGKIVISY